MSDIAPPLPQSLEAERSVLGAVLLDNAALTVAQEIVGPGDFFLFQNRVIYRAMCDLAKSSGAIDTVLLFEWLSQHGDLEKAGGVGYLSQLPDGLPRVSHVRYYAELVKLKARGRALITQRQGDIDRLMAANGDLKAVIEDIAINSAHIHMEFGQKESSALFCTAADATDEPTPEFIVKPYILAGAVTELVAKIKAGKTTYVLGEIVRQAAIKGPVLYLSEQPKTSFRVALARAGLVGLESLHILYFNRVISRPWDEIARNAAAKCRSTQAVLLVVDTLSHFCGLDGDSENDSGAAISSMKPLQNIAADGTAVLTVRHERKSGGEIGDAGRGSSAFGGAADTLLTLRRPEGRTRPTLRKIECVSRFEGLPAEAIYEYEDGRYRYMGTENEICDREAETLILGAAPDTEDNAKTLDDLLLGSQVARTTAQRVAKRLCSEGRLQQIGKGKRGNAFRYLLPEKVSAQTTHI